MTRTATEVREVVAVALDDAVFFSNGGLHPAGDRLLAVRQMQKSACLLLLVQLRPSNTKGFRLDHNTSRH